MDLSIILDNDYVWLNVSI